MEISDNSHPAPAQRPQRPARKQVPLRLDPRVYDAIAKWASDELRSVNAQIEVILRRALKEAGRDPRPDPMRGPGRPPRENDSPGNNSTQ